MKRSLILGLLAFATGAFLIGCAGSLPSVKVPVPAPPVTQHVTIRDDGTLDKENTNKAIQNVQGMSEYIDELLQASCYEEGK